MVYYCEKKMKIFCFPPLRVRLAAGPAGPGGGRLLHVSMLRRQLPLPGRRCRPLPQPDLLHLPGLMMGHPKPKKKKTAPESLCFPKDEQQHVNVWQQTIITTVYCLFKAEVLVLDRHK